MSRARTFATQITIDQDTTRYDSVYLTSSKKL